MKKIVFFTLLMQIMGSLQAQDLVIARQGHFSVGGKTLKHPGEYDNSKFVGWATQVEAGQSYRSDHAFVDFQIPANAHKLPLVYVISSKSSMLSTSGKVIFRHLFTPLASSQASKSPVGAVSNVTVL